MATRKVFHVTWSAVLRRWQVLEITGKNYAHRVVRRSKLKTTAVKTACSKARSRRHIGQVVIHLRNGTIEHEFTYGADPVKAKG